MPKIVSVINLKGGVAKTTTTVQLAEALTVEFGKRVLVIDLDPQTNATISLISEEKWEEVDGNGQTLFHLFYDKIEKTNRFSVDKAVLKGVSNLKSETLHLLPSSIRFIDIQDRIGDVSYKTHHMTSPQEVLKSISVPLFRDYDYVLIDCPPNLGYITRNGIEISDFYLIPTIPDTLSTYGIPQILKQVHELSVARNLPIKCLGLLVTKFDSRSNAHARGIRNLPSRFREQFKKLGLPEAPVFKTIIPQANATAEAMEYGIETNGAKFTFKQKYGRSKSGERYLYEYVEDLTREFIGYVGN
jgi:chromosome partitioning protein